MTDTKLAPDTKPRIWRTSIVLTPAQVEWLDQEARRLLESGVVLPGDASRSVVIRNLIDSARGADETEGRAA